MYDLVIRGGRLVTDTDVVEADLAVTDGRIAAVGANLPAAETVQARGLLVLPGGVDPHVHLEQTEFATAPADTWETGTASALAGGTTTVICFAWQPVGGSLVGAVGRTLDRARKARADYALHPVITDPTAQTLGEELPALVAAGHTSLKVFMTYDGVRLDDRGLIRTLAAARRHGALVAVHAENHDLIVWLTEQLLDAGLTAPKYHAVAKPIVAEREAVHRIISFAEALDAPVQIFHVSGQAPAEEIERAQRRGLQVFGETCVQYLTLTADDLDRPGFEGAKYVFGPPARTKQAQAALWQAIRRGVLDIVSSDHSPLRYDDPRGKMIAGPAASFDRIPNGIPGLAARLPVLFTEGVAAGRIDLPHFVRLVSTNPARRFGLYPEKGSLAVGADADLVLWDPEREVILDNAAMHHGGDYTPYEGYRCRGGIVATYLRGRRVYADGEVLGQPGDGRWRARRPAVTPAGLFPTGFDPINRVMTTTRTR